MTSGIADKERDLRDLINAPRRHRALRSDAPKFSQLCSALDVLGDTVLALAAYLELSADAQNDAILYLQTYGVLQALILQQDAVTHIADSLGIEYTTAPRLLEIREIRNNSIGHPTRRGGAPGRAFNHIVRVSLTVTGFTLYTFDAQGQMTQQVIDVPSLIVDQREVIESALADFITAEVDREASHRAQFGDDPLSAVFPASLDYSLGKIAEEIGASKAIGLGESLLGGVGDAITAFEEKLRQRGDLDASPEVFEYHMVPARHAITRLREYFEHGPRECPGHEDATAFLAHLSSHLGSLKNLALEIDETYASRVEP